MIQRINTRLTGYSPKAKTSSVVSSIVDTFKPDVDAVSEGSNSTGIGKVLDPESLADDTLDRLSQEGIDINKFNPLRSNDRISRLEDLFRNSDNDFMSLSLIYLRVKKIITGNLTCSRISLKSHSIY